MRVLVVGGAGYVGDFLVNTLLIKGYDVIVFDNLMYSDRFFKPVKFIYGDITKPEQVRDAIIGRKIDYVIWAAALVGDALCAKDPEYTKTINVEAVRSFSKTYDGPCFFFSTCSVYGANNDLLDEESPVNPLSVYASTKLEAERILLERQNVLVYRLGTLLGLSGEDARPRMDLVGNALTLKAVRDQPITVFGGEQMRPLMSVKEVAHAVCFGIDRKLTGLFTIAEKNMNISELATQIKARTDSKSEIVVTDIPFEDMRNYRVDCSKLKNAGWSTLYPIRLAIDEFAQTIRESRVKNADLNLYYNGRYSI
jgi:nucleoside-diphosphate-sugar epimerase